MVARWQFNSFIEVTFVFFSFNMLNRVPYMKVDQSVYAKRGYDDAGETQKTSKFMKANCMEFVAFTYKRTLCYFFHSFFEQLFILIISLPHNHTCYHIFICNLIILFFFSPSLTHSISH